MSYNYLFSVLFLVLYHIHTVDKRLIETSRFGFDLVSWFVSLVESLVAPDWRIYSQ